jgi:hypothetical protein
MARPVAMLLTTLSALAPFMMFTAAAEVSAHEGDGFGAFFIHACVEEKTGKTRIVGEQGVCKELKETALHWPRFHIDRSAIGIVRLEATVPADGATNTTTFKSLRVDCPEGTEVISGGASLYGTVAFPHTMLSNTPSNPTSFPRGWSASAAFNQFCSGADCPAWGLRVRVLCSPDAFIVAPEDLPGQ